MTFDLGIKINKNYPGITGISDFYLIIIITELCTEVLLSGNLGEFANCGTCCMFLTSECWQV